MIEETKDPEIYNKIPLHIRIAIRVFILVFNILSKLLERHGMSPSFSIYLSKPEKKERHLSIVDDEGPIQ
jgi:hypothetical protein